MNNHYHVLLSGVAEQGMSKFLKKLNMGYSKYFNARYERVGTLFQGKTKKILIDREAHFLYILHYIHFNPLDYNAACKTWREKRITSSSQAFAALAKYRWSSYRDYLGMENFPEIVAGSFMFEDRREHMRESKRYLTVLQEDPPFVTFSDLE